jgi:hypothetical protein
MFLFVYTRCGSRGRGCAPGAPPPPPPPPKIGTNMIFWRKIVIFHTKYPKHFAPPSAIGKNMIFWRKIVIFHTKYSPKKIKCGYTRTHYPDSQPNTHTHCSCILSEDAVLSPTQSALKPWSTTLEASTLTNHFPTITVSHIELCTQPQIPLLRHFILIFLKEFK